MSIRKIIQLGDARLRAISPVLMLDQITKSEIQDLIKDLKDTLMQENDGVGISAPQIGVNKRIFIVSHKVLKGKNLNTNDDLVCINPEIIKHSVKTDWKEEGCLSIRWQYGEVERYKKVTLRAYNEEGKVFTYGASGLIARVFQHELDHLDGILFIDKARGLHEITKEEIKERTHGLVE